MAACNFSDEPRADLARSTLFGQGSLTGELDAEGNLLGEVAGVYGQPPMKFGVGGRAQILPTPNWPPVIELSGVGGPPGIGESSSSEASAQLPALTARHFTGTLLRTGAGWGSLSNQTEYNFVRGEDNKNEGQENFVDGSDDEILSNNCVDEPNRIGNESDTIPDIDWGIESDGEGENAGSIDEEIGLKWEYRDETWRDPNFVYSPMPSPFNGPRMGPSRHFRTLPSYFTLFSLFWTPTILNAIVNESNRYANSLDELGHMRGGPRWTNLTVTDLQAYMACAIYMGLKGQPNYYTYWSRNPL